MNVIIWLLVSGIIGSTIGWAASVAVRNEVTQYAIVNVVVGAVGAMLGACLLSPEFGTALFNRGSIPLDGLVASSFGACVFAGIVFLCWRDRRT